MVIYYRVYVLSGYVHVNYRADDHSGRMQRGCTPKQQRSLLSVDTSGLAGTTSLFGGTKGERVVGGGGSGEVSLCGIQGDPYNVFTYTLIFSGKAVVSCFETKILFKFVNNNMLNNFVYV